MAKNKIQDLRDHIFAQMERLGEEGLTVEKMDAEVKRAKAMSELGKVIVESAKAETDFRHKLGKEATSGNFMQIG